MIEVGHLIEEEIPKLVELEDHDLLVRRISSNLSLARYRRGEIRSFVDENLYDLKEVTKWIESIGVREEQRTQLKEANIQNISVEEKVIVTEPKWNA